ncbi:lipopolysaccharide heptosyltransferase II [Deltaproteobacteria bacterium]|nr:lipopolysaccharide heptosyltransferase II [Deltaproteobacteria bacterium]
MMIRFPGNSPINKSEINRILIRATNWVGDVVMTLPALEAVKDCFPESTVTVLAKPWVMPLFKSHPMVDDVLPLGKGEGLFTGLAEIRRVIFQIRRQRFDLAILFQNAFEAALIAYLCGIKYRVGYNTDHRTLLLSHALRKDDKIMSCHQVEYYLNLLRAMGCNAKLKDPELFVFEEYESIILSTLSEGGVTQRDFLLGLSPGASFGPAKRWPPDRFAALADMAVEKWGAKVIIFGSQGEKGICAEVSDKMNHSSMDLCGKTELGEAMALIRRCNLFVSNDSGLMHIAAALSVPLVAVFGSTDPVATGPRGTKTKIVRHQVDCAPCLQPECPRDYSCMLSISPEDVWNKMSDLKNEMESI